MAVAVGGAAVEQRATRQPHHPVEPEPGEQPLGDRCFVEVPVAVGVQHAVLGGHQGVAAVGGDGPALHDDVDLLHPVAELLGERGARTCVAVALGVALAVGVEHDVPGLDALAVGDVDGAVVARPTAVHRDDADVGGRVQTLASHCGTGFVGGHHGDGLELGDGVGHAGALVLHLGEERPPHALAARPEHEGALVGNPLAGQRQPTAHRQVSTQCRYRGSSPRVARE